MNMKLSRIAVLAVVATTVAAGPAFSMGRHDAAKSSDTSTDQKNSQFGKQPAEDKGGAGSSGSASDADRGTIANDASIDGAHSVSPAADPADRTTTGVGGGAAGTSPSGVSNGSSGNSGSATGGAVAQ